MDSTELNEEILREAIAKAREAATIARLSEPVARSAVYDPNTGCISIKLQHGATYSFPSEIAQGLTGASPEHLAEVEVTPSGIGLHWETLDVDLSVPALIAGIYGNQEWMENLIKTRVVRGDDRTPNVLKGRR